MLCLPILEPYVVQRRPLAAGRLVLASVKVLFDSFKGLIHFNLRSLWVYIPLPVPGNLPRKISGVAIIVCSD